MLCWKIDLLKIFVGYYCSLEKPTEIEHHLHEYGSVQYHIQVQPLSFTWDYVCWTFEIMSWWLADCLVVFRAGSTAHLLVNCHSIVVARGSFIWWALTLHRWDGKTNLLSCHWDHWTCKRRIRTYSKNQLCKNFAWGR